MHTNVVEEYIRKATCRANALWSAGGALTHPDTMWTGSTLTGTAPIRWIQTWQSVQSGQFKIMLNTIQKWEEEGIPRVSNMEGVRHPQPQHVPHLQREELSYTNPVTRKDSDL